MSLLALSLVLTSAVIHATWNLLAKRVSGGSTFVWLFDTVSLVLYAPLAFALVALHGAPISGLGLVLVVTSAALHATYFLLLSRGYRAGDLSLVYPLARGTGPLLAIVAAITFLGERPGAIALTGALCIIAGAVVLTGDPRRLLGGVTGAAATYALLTGACIAAYTLVDKEAVSVARLLPLIYYWSINLGSWLILTPQALSRRREVAELWTRWRWEAIGIGVLSPLSYILVLTALSFSPVSYVAPAREIGILFGTLMGARWLAEGDTGRRLLGAGVMVVGIISLAIN